MTRRSLAVSGLMALVAVFVIVGHDSLGAVVAAASADRAVTRRALGPGPVVFGTITGRLEVCNRLAPRHCRVQSATVCGTNLGCVSADRARVVDTAGTVSTTRLRRGRFSVRVTPGRCSVELLGDGPRVHGRVLEDQTVRLRRYGVVTVTFRITDP